MRIYQENKLIHENNNIPSIYKKNEYLKFNNEDGIIVIDLKNYHFKRQTSEYIFEIDFNNKEMSYKLIKENYNFENIAIKCNLTYDDNIEIEYDFDGQRKIIVELG